jgi:hypothetical protein
MGFGAAAFGRRFRLYSLVSLAVVVTFNVLAIAYAPEVDARTRLKLTQGNQRR